MNVMETEDDGVLRERITVSSIAGGARLDPSARAPLTLTLMLEKFDTVGKLQSTAFSDYVFAAVRNTEDEPDRYQFNFCMALNLLMHAGKKVARADIPWQAGHQFVYLVPGSEFAVNRAPLMGIYPEGTLIRYRPHLDVRYFDGTCGVWTPTQEDIMASDWHVVA